MAGSDGDPEDALRERAYFIWEREGCPEGRAHHHWLTAIEEADRGDEFMDEEEKILADRPDANMPALLTKDVLGG